MSVTDLLNAIVLMANFVLVPAVVYGSQLALGALGITIIYAVLRFSNFAHGDSMAFGTMVVIFGTWYLQAAGVSIAPLPTALLALPIGIIATALLLLACDRVVYRYYRRCKSTPVVLMIVSVGVMLVLHGLVRFLIGPHDRNFADGARFIIKARDFKAFTGLAEGLTIKVSQGLTVTIVILAVALLFWFLRRTRTGHAMRAYADNEDLALLSGVNPDRVVMLAWLIAAILATVAGTLYGLDKSFKPFTYFQLLLPMFAAAIVGGIGQPHGAIAGGFVIAFSEILLTYAHKKFFTYLLTADYAPQGLVQLLSTEYRLAVSFIILVVVLVIRPTGIFRGRVP